ncbi:hypothetical protein JOC36_001480 [Weissella uvarum]|uniref:hypothetical protein n=1 Tax=Weissella uvarum TaxID=1479233 RepID=UPI0019618376|nr:hypothetical protein [Weissella uvarum]MBM7617887.1 hypothetical protein [Weissella uvarum]MCM0596115.1 hypothetical protein [Weissella uvarum]
MPAKRDGEVLKDVHFRIYDDEADLLQYVQEYSDANGVTFNNAIKAIIKESKEGMPNKSSIEDMVSKILADSMSGQSSTVTEEKETTPKSKKSTVNVKDLDLGSIAGKIV